MTHKFKNVSPLGDLEIPALLREPIEAGEVFEVPDDLAEHFAAQSANFEEVGEDVPTTAELREKDAADAAAAAEAEAEAQRKKNEKAAADAAAKNAKEAGQ